MPSSANALASTTFNVAQRVDVVAAILRSAAIAPHHPGTGTPATPLPAAHDQAGAQTASPSPLQLAPGSARPAGAREAPAVTTSGHALPVSESSGAAENVRIGALARAIAMALAPASAAAVRPAGSAAPAGVSGNAPLDILPVDASVDQPARFAQAIGDAVRHSGASYEARLKDWVEGRQTLEQVRSEGRATPYSTVRTAHLAGAPSMPQSPTAGILEATRTPVAVPPVEQAGMPARMTETMHQQITAAQIRCVETGDIRFAFQAWPGQHCELVLHPHEQPPGGRHGESVDAPDASSGDSTLTLDLPHLGALRARVHTSNSDVRIMLSANPAAAGQLSRATAALAYGMGIAGLKLNSVVVHDPAT